MNYNLFQLEKVQIQKKECRATKMQNSRILRQMKIRTWHFKILNENAKTKYEANQV